MVKAERGPTALAVGGFVLAEWGPPLPQPRGCLSPGDSVGFAAGRSAWACGSADVIIAAFDGRVRLQLAGLLERL